MRLVAVDWGTSSFRAALQDADGQVLQEMSSPHGILNVPKQDFAFYLIAKCGHWITEKSHILMSGMVGSQNGWQLTPYCACPTGFEELVTQLTWLQPVQTPGWPTRTPIAIVPGLSCEHAHAPDVMRGEETQIFGAMRLAGSRDGCFVLPGTHSKWAWVQDGCIQRFKTLMTGEVFAALSQHTILSRTVDPHAALDEEAFLQGIDLARAGPGLLHNAFAARTLALFQRMSPAALASYLSGLCIGDELRAMLAPAQKQVVLIGSAALTQRYAMALQRHGVTSRVFGAESTWAGLHALSKAMPTQNL